MNYSFSCLVEIDCWDNVLQGRVRILDNCLTKEKD